MHHDNGTMEWFEIEKIYNPYRWSIFSYFANIWLPLWCSDLLTHWKSNASGNQAYFPQESTSIKESTLECCYPQCTSTSASYKCLGFKWSFLILGANASPSATPIVGEVRQWSCEFLSCLKKGDQIRVKVNFELCYYICNHIYLNTKYVIKHWKLTTIFQRYNLKNQKYVTIFHGESKLRS